jgi:hypothetical protein
MRWEYSCFCSLTHRSIFLCLTHGAIAGVTTSLESMHLGELEMWCACPFPLQVMVTTLRSLGQKKESSPLLSAASSHLF